MSKWVLIDISWLAHRAWHTTGDLRNGRDATGVVFGVLEQIRSICYHPKVMSNQVVAFFDSDRSVRKDEFPGYKSNRKKHEYTELEQREYVAFRQQLSAMQTHLLSEIGIQVVQQDGLEADDLIASAAKSLTVTAGLTKFETHTDTGVMVTADSDLFQAISANVHWLNPLQNRYMTPADMIRTVGVPSDQWSLVKAMAGCSSDAVPGIPGVGEKSAIDFLRKRLPIQHRYNAIVSVKGQRIIRRNLRLVDLPHPTTKPVALYPPKWSTVGFASVCEQYGFRSAMEGGRGASWKRILRSKPGEFGHLQIPTRRRGERRERAKA